MTSKPGSIFVVATPIGNLDDISKRALDVLKSVDVIFAEDTRHSAKLLSRYGIKARVSALHDHNERDISASIIERVRAGEDVAVISDAGTPLVSDPGYHLTKLAHENHVSLVPVPGPSAVVAALSVCGLPTDRFSFEGFLPARRSQRRERLGLLSTYAHTLVFFESPHRILATLEDMAELFGGERIATVAKELTKVHETVRTDTIRALHAWMAERPERQKGEFVIIVAGANEVGDGDDEAQQKLLELLLAELPLKSAVRLAASISGANRNVLYELALRLDRADNR